MAEYLILAENITFKNNRLTCINIYDRLSTIAMPSEFRFDLAIMCGPNWSVGEHKLVIKASGNNGKEVYIGELTVNIPNEDFVYSAFADNLKLIVDYSVETLTFVVYDNDKKIISRNYPVISMLVPQTAVENSVPGTARPAEKTEKKTTELKKNVASENKEETENITPSKGTSRFGTPRRPKYGEFLNLKTLQELKEAMIFIAKMPDENQMKQKLKANIEQQLKVLNSKKK